MNNDNAELIVKIIAALGYTGAAVTIFIGLAMLLGGGFIAAIFPSYSTLISTIAVVLAIIIIAIGIFSIFVSRALSNHKNWARIFIIISSALGAISSLTSPLGGIIGVAIYGGIIYFLAFEKTIVGLFK